MDRNNVMLLKLESFKYVTSLNLNIGCYNIQLSEYSSRLCMIILTWVKYRYNHLPMGVINSPYTLTSSNRKRMNCSKGLSLYFCT